MEMTIDFTTFELREFTDADWSQFPAMAHFQNGEAPLIGSQVFGEDEVTLVLSDSGLEVVYGDRTGLTAWRLPLALPVESREEARDLLQASTPWDSPDSWERLL